MGYTCTKKASRTQSCQSEVTSVFSLLFIEPTFWRLLHYRRISHFKLFFFQAFQCFNLTSPSGTNCFTFSDHPKQSNIYPLLLSRILYFKMWNACGEKRTALKLASAFVTDPARSVAIALPGQCHALVTQWSLTQWIRRGRVCTGEFV